MPSLFEDPNFWSAVSAVGGAASAAAALATIWQSRLASKEAREAQRPYFLLEGPGIKALPQSPPFRVMLPLRNSGLRPATMFEGRIYIATVLPGGKPVLDIRFSVANPIPPSSPTPWYNDTLVLPPQLPPHFVFLGIEYADPLSNQRYTQPFYMRWDGVQNGTTQPDFVHVTAQEKAAINSQFAEIVGPYQRDG
jgi:hypothetical protein